MIPGRFPSPSGTGLSAATADEKYEYIKVEGQRSRPATTLFFLEVFPRNAQTRELIEALARFNYQGSRSWDFDGGELHKRVVARWLRRNSERIIRGSRRPMTSRLIAARVRRGGVTCPRLPHP